MLNSTGNDFVDEPSSSGPSSSASRSDAAVRGTVSVTLLTQCFPRARCPAQHLLSPSGSPSRSPLGNAISFNPPSMGPSVSAKRIGLSEPPSSSLSPSGFVFGCIPGNVKEDQPGQRPYRRCGLGGIVDYSPPQVEGKFVDSFAFRTTRQWAELSLLLQLQVH